MSSLNKIIKFLNLFKNHFNLQFISIFILFILNIDQCNTQIGLGVKLASRLAPIGLSVGKALKTVNSLFNDPSAPQQSMGEQQQDPMNTAKQMYNNNEQENGKK
uniref:Uncharacterized protein n=1 Tax=Meloidogyne hapla TaxID=6305 RepID=A0A1I8BVQ6_MELHA